VVDFRSKKAFVINDLAGPWPKSLIIKAFFPVHPYSSSWLYGCTVVPGCMDVQ
jgi:hypothetical protein